MTVLVTGGGGFLGGAIVRQLLARGVAVRSFTRSAYSWLAELGVEQVQGHLEKFEDVERAVAGCTTVFHVAAKAGVWGHYEDYYSTNVQGTKNLLTASLAAGVKQFLYTSTPSVVHAGGDIENGDETLPYPKRFSAEYPETKAIAERFVMQSSDDRFHTVSLRPHLIWGPGDPHLIPRLLAKARAGKLRRIGTRDVKVDVTFVDNAALAHLQAWDALVTGAPIGGRAYFISNGEPVPLWDFLHRILALHGLPPVTRSVPVWLATAGAMAVESLHRLFRLKAEPAMTKFVVEQLSTSHWYNISAAQRDFGYTPTVSIEEGLRRIMPPTQEP
jgi:2-alkyl-3-oxoalkanoate reductase